jgi:hypothetical protein
LTEGHCEGEGGDDEPGGEEQVYPDLAVDVAVVRAKHSGEGGGDEGEARAHAVARHTPDVDVVPDLDLTEQGRGHWRQHHARHLRLHEQEDGAQRGRQPADGRRRVQPQRGDLRGRDEGCAGCGARSGGCGESNTWVQRRLEEGAALDGVVATDGGGVHGVDCAVHECRVKAFVCDCGQLGQHRWLRPVDEGLHVAAEARWDKHAADDGAFAQDGGVGEHSGPQIVCRRARRPVDDGEHAGVGGRLRGLEEGVEQRVGLRATVQVTEQDARAARIECRPVACTVHAKVVTGCEVEGKASSRGSFAACCG